MDDLTPRQRAIVWAKWVSENPDTVFCDSETTGIGPHSPMVDLAIVDHSGKVLLDTLINPEIPIPPEASSIHGITDDMVALAPKFPDIVQKVIKLLGGRIVCVYNAGYDGLIINNAVVRAGRGPISTQWECAMLAYGEFDGTWNTRKGGFKWHKLDAAAERFGIPPGGHRALADTQTARLVVAAMAAEGGA